MSLDDVEIDALMTAYQAEIDGMAEQAREKWVHFREEHGDDAVPDFLGQYMFNASLKTCQFTMACCMLVAQWMFHRIGLHEHEDTVQEELYEFLERMDGILSRRSQGGPADPSSN